MAPPHTPAEIARYNRELDDFKRFLWAGTNITPNGPIAGAVYQDGLTVAQEETAAENLRLFLECCQNYERKVRESKTRKNRLSGKEPLKSGMEIFAGMGPLMFESKQ
jgi:hypothetical protein